MQNSVRTRTLGIVALAVGMTLTGCGGGGGGSQASQSSPSVTTSPTVPASPPPPVTHPTTPVTGPVVPVTGPTTPPATSVRQTMAGKSVVVKAARGAQLRPAAPRLSTFRRGHVVDVSADVIEEVLVFDSSGNPDLTQSRVLDLTQDSGAVLDSATLGDDGTFSETFHFSGTPAETDSVTGTLTPANGGASVTLTGGSDVVTLGGTPATLLLHLAGIAQTPTDPATLHLTAGTYGGGGVTVTDGNGRALSAPQLSLTFDASGTLLGGLDYTAAAGALQSQTVSGALDADGEFFDTSSLGAQTFSDQFSIAPSTATPGAVTVSGVILDQTGAVVVVYSGTLSPVP